MPKWGLLVQNTRFKFCALVLLSITLIGVFGPFLANNPGETTRDTNEPPSFEHLLGTDAMGRDVLSRIVVGIRKSLLVGLTAGGICVTIALLIGGVGAYLGGLKDETLNLITNVFLVIPYIPLLIILSAMFEGRSLLLVAVLLGITMWAGSARSIRSQVLSLKERNFVDLARISGKGNLNIVFMEIFPNMLAYIAVSLFGTIGAAILAEAGLSVIGLGPTTAITLGKTLYEAIGHHAVLRGSWWTLIPPGIILMTITGSLLTLVSVIDQVLNPKLRGR